MEFRDIKLFWLLVTLLAAIATQLACASTFGADDADPFSVESAEDAMSDEEEQEVWESINR